jgi:2-amino-4-hydroxy-6-hydroxymethyldihydropteridine diphosphokinase
MNWYCVGLGSNLGIKSDNLEQAFQAISANPNIFDFQKSSIYQSKPLDNKPQDDYLNAVAICQSSLLPLQMLHFLQSIENQLGRIRTSDKFASRTLDLDILLIYQNKPFILDNCVTIGSNELTVPHYDLARRDFVIFPLLELLGDIEIANLGALKDLSLNVHNNLVKLQ